jgi:siroheme synthase-like protein
MQSSDMDERGNEHDDGIRRKAFPMAFVTTGRHLLIVGGGIETAVRVRHALAFDWATIILIVPALTDELADLAGGDSRVIFHQREVTEEDVREADLVLEDTGKPAVARQISAWCRAQRVPLNAVDKPEFCDLYYMSHILRGPLVVSISSGGDAPALSASLRLWLDERLGPGWGTAARLMAELRQRLPSGQVRMNLLKAIARQPRLLDLIERNDEAGMRAWIEDEISRLRT